MKDAQEFFKVDSLVMQRAKAKQRKILQRDEIAHLAHRNRVLEDMMRAVAGVEAEAAYLKQRQADLASWGEQEDI